MAKPRQQLITDAVVTQLGSLSGVTVFRGEVAVSPTPAADTGRIAPYVVLHSFAKAAGADPDVGDSAVDMTYTCQLTCAAGFEADAEWVVDQVDGLMDRWTPSVSGVVVGRFRPPPGFTPGTVRLDETVMPPRYVGVLQYRTLATT